MTELISQIRETERILQSVSTDESLTEYIRDLRVFELTQLLLILRQELVDRVELDLKVA